MLEKDEKTLTSADASALLSSYQSVGINLQMVRKQLFKC